MIRPRRGIIGRMRELGRRLLIGMAVAAVAVMAVGYAFIFGGIATPVRGDRAILDLPAEGEAAATILDDGRPVFIVNDPAVGVWVLDAEGRQPTAAVGVLVAWCPATRTFADVTDGSAYAPNGELLSGPAEGGLVAFASRRVADDASRVIVGSDTSVQGRAAPNGNPPSATCADGWVTHAPQPGEVFDPSVAVDQEPPGWIWLEGALGIGDDGTVQLCDRGTDALACERSAGVNGIDPALLRDDQSGPTEGQFIGRVGDGAIEGLILVPDLVEES
jgi:hypothetical protein